MDVILVAIGALLVTSLLVAGFRAVTRWRGVRRLLAVVVVLSVAAWAIKIVIDLRRDPTSHNLWPFEAVGSAGLALVVLGALALTRPRLHERRQGAAPRSE